MTRFSGLCTGVSLVAAAFCLAAAPVWAERAVVRGAPSEIATTYQIDPAHDGNIDFAAGFPPPLKQAWSKDIVYTIGTNSPIIADGAVFVSAGGFNFRLALANGHTDFQKSGTPGLLTYDNGTLFSLSFEGILTSLNKDTGKKIWATQLPDQYQFTAPPMAVNGQVFIGGSGVGGDLYAVDEATGHLNWEQPVDGADVSSPSFGDNGIYVDYPCRYYKFDPVTGKLIWHRFGVDSGGGGATVVYFNKQLLVQDDCSDEGNTVRKSKSGKVVGTFTSQWQWTPAVFVGSKGLYLGVNLEEDATGWVMHCWNIKTNKQLWTYKGSGDLSTRPIVVNGVIYVADGLGNIFGVDETGHQVWTAQAPHLNGAAGLLSAGQGTLIYISNSMVTAYVPQ